MRELKLLIDVAVAGALFGLQMHKRKEVRKVPRYMIQATPTPQNVAALLQNPEDRTEAVRRVLEAAGCKLEQYYNSFAEGTTFVVADIPDEANLDALMATFFAGGGVTSIRATPIKTASESVDVYQRAASLAYRPPGK